MTQAKIIDGKEIAIALRQKIKEEVADFVAQGYPTPGLGTVLVGENVASQTYIRMKRKASAEAGIQSFHYQLPQETTQAELEAVIAELNENTAVHGILVQLPLPEGLDENRILSLILPEKDIDGFHPVNMGSLAQKGRDSLHHPCTPSGVIYLLKETLGDLSGLNAVVLGRSNIVGVPTALLLLKENATVTICHSRTKNIPEITRQADVLVAAVGRHEMVRGDWIKPGATVIDVGINEVEDPTAKRGYRLVGDVQYEEARLVAGAITPVPGGVGPMTIAMLLENTLHAAKIQARQLSDN